MTEKSCIWSFMLSKSLLRMVDIFGNYTSPLWGNSLLPTPAPIPSFLDCWDLLQAVSCLLSWNHLWGTLSKRAEPIIAGHRPTSVQTVCRESTLTINPVCHLQYHARIARAMPFSYSHTWNNVWWFWTHSTPVDPIGRNMTCVYWGQTKVFSTVVKKIGRKAKKCSISNYSSQF